MQWSLIKSWAKNHGYVVSRKITADGQKNQYDYYWEKTENNTPISGITTSVSKLATIIYNNLTDDKYVQYQNEYKDALSKQDIDHNGLSGQW